MATASTFEMALPSAEVFHFVSVVDDLHAMFPSTVSAETGGIPSVLTFQS